MESAPRLEQVVREPRGVARILLFLLVCGGVLAAAAYSYFGDEKRQFVNACIRNQFAESECACTFAAYKRLAPPYSDLVKASVHASSESYRHAVIAVVLRKAGQVSLGFDPSDFAKEIRNVPRDKILKTGLRLLGKVASSHRRALIAQATGIGQVIVVWWGTFAVGLEAAHARYVVEEECGGLFTNSWAAAGQVWKRAKDAVGNGWSVVKSSSGKLWPW